MAERKIKDLAFHEAANIFPMMEPSAFREFKADLEEHGVLEPAKILDGKVLDGRNRYRACLELGIKLPTVPVETDDPVAYVVSQNACRRHLTPSQLSLVAARAREFYDKEAKERMSEGGMQGRNKQLHGGVVTLPPPQKSRDAAGKALGVSGKLVDHATKVLRRAVPEVVKAVEDGRMSVTTGAMLAHEPPEVQRQELNSRRRGRSERLRRDSRAASSAGIKPRPGLPHRTNGPTPRPVSPNIGRPGRQTYLPHRAVRR